MRCSKCGEKLMEDAKFCGKCGSPVKKEDVANSEVKPETKDDGGIVQPMKVLLGLVGGFALFFYLMNTFLGSSSNRKPTQQPTQQTQQQTQQQQQQQKQQQSKRVTTEEKLGLKFYDFKVDTMPEVDIKKEGSALVGVSCMIENVSQDTVKLYTGKFFLRKQGQNTFKTIWSNSGFTKSLTADNARRRTVGVSYDSTIDLFPGDKTYAVFVFDTNIMGGDITDWVLCMKYTDKKDSKQKLFPIVKF